MQVMTEFVVCRKLSLITPLQLMLFGGCDVNYVDECSVVIGDM